MHERWRRQAERVVQQQLARRRRDKILASHHFRYSLRRIIHDHSQLIGRRAGHASSRRSLPNDEIAANCSQVDVHRAAETINERGRISRHAEAPAIGSITQCFHVTHAATGAGDVEALGDRPYCWRFRVPADSPAFIDGFRGPMHIDLRTVGGDFVVWKTPPAGSVASTPAYQLAVVVDDAAQGVTEVVRGEDLIPSTPRQLLLYDALGLTPPSFVHVPLVVGPDGRRLAKRHGDTRLSAMREAGVRPEMFLGLL